MARKVLVGIDEVGRGCLAGPITVGAILTKNPLRFFKIKNSKELSAKQRIEWQGKIKNKPVKISISSVGQRIIDRVGISRAATLAVGRCLRKLKIQNKKCKILLDGSLYAPRTCLNQRTIIRGDEKIPLIAAASIVAKVHRDKKMLRFHKKFPEYGFDAHKGYGTKFHQHAIKKHGLCALHRRSFCANIFS